MKPLPPLATRLLLVAAGLLAGIYLQHRWPLGRLAADWHRQPTPAGPSLADLARGPAAHRLVIVVAGQSNAGNYGSTRRSAGPTVYAFADGRVYAAVDPLPGADGDGGSIWTRLGARLALTGRYDAIILAVVAEGSTRLDDWIPGGRCHPRLAETLQQLAQAGLPADYFLWQQGETEGASPDAAGRDYGHGLLALHALARASSPGVRFVVARSTFGAAAAVNEQIRLAQAAAAGLAGASPGPDLDTLGPDYRRDGTHFNDRGLDAAADLWLRALSGPAQANQPRAARP